MAGFMKDHFILILIFKHYIFLFVYSSAMNNKAITTTLFFYKNNFYKNIEAQNGQKIKDEPKTIPASE